MKNKTHFWLLAVMVCVLFAGVAVAAAEIQKSQQRSTQVVGMTVYNTQGEKLGKVDDLLLTSDGCAKYVVLSHGGLLGIGDKLIPIPWTALKPGKEEKSLMVNMSKQALEKAPNFDPKKWPDMSSAEWQKNFEYYRDKPSTESKKDASSK